VWGKTTDTKEDGNPCPDKLVEGPPVMGAVPPSVAVVAGSTEGGGEPCPAKLTDRFIAGKPNCLEDDGLPCPDKLVDGPPVMGPAPI